MSFQAAEQESKSTTTNAQKDPKDFLVSPSAPVDIRQYKPEVDENGTWWVSEIDCEFLATGCSTLACGGGGPGYMCYMAARAAIKAGARMPIVDVESLPDDTYVLGSISYGYVIPALLFQATTCSRLPVLQLSHSSVFLVGPNPWTLRTHC